MRPCSQRPYADENEENERGYKFTQRFSLDDEPTFRIKTQGMECNEFLGKLKGIKSSRKKKNGAKAQKAVEDQPCPFNLRAGFFSEPTDLIPFFVSEKKRNLYARYVRSKKGL